MSRLKTQSFGLGSGGARTLLEGVALRQRVWWMISAVVGGSWLRLLSSCGGAHKALLWASFFGGSWPGPMALALSSHCFFIGDFAWQFASRCGGW
jgi:hypothetical protein